jgi:Flp pilus assembly pilin Flp
MQELRLNTEFKYTTSLSKNLFLRQVIRLRRFHGDETGQGLVEYLLILAFVALASTVGMSTAASYINSAFTKLGSNIGNRIS